MQGDPHLLTHQDSLLAPGALKGYLECCAAHEYKGDSGVLLTDSSTVAVVQNSP